MNPSHLTPGLHVDDPSFYEVVESPHGRDNEIGTFRTGAPMCPAGGLSFLCGGRQGVFIGTRADGAELGRPNTLLVKKLVLPESLG